MSTTLEGWLFTKEKELIYEEDSKEILLNILRLVPEKFISDKIDKPRIRYYYDENNVVCCDDTVYFEKEIKFDDKLISDIKEKVPECLLDSLQEKFNKLINNIENQYMVDVDCSLYLILYS